MIEFGYDHPKTLTMAIYYIGTQNMSSACGQSTVACAEVCEAKKNKTSAISYRSAILLGDARLVTLTSQLSHQTLSASGSWRELMDFRIKGELLSSSPDLANWQSSRSCSPSHRGHMIALAEDRTVLADAGLGKCRS